MPGPLINSGYTPGPRQLIAGTPVPWVYSLSDYATGLFIQLVRRPYRATQTNYGSSNPVVIGTAVASQLATPIHITFVQTRQTRQTSTKLGLPTILAAPGLSAPIRVSITRSTTQARQSQHNLRSPAIVGPGIVFAPITKALTRSATQARNIHSKIFAPSVIGSATVFRAIKVQLSQATKSRIQTKSRLFPPILVTNVPPFTATHIKSTFASQPLQPQHVGQYGVAPPQIINVFSASPTPDQLILKIKLISSVMPSRQTHYKLIKPLILGAGVVFNSISVKTVQTPRNKFVNHSRLMLPQVLYGTAGPVVVGHEMIFLTNYGVY